MSGRAATTDVIPGDYALSVGLPKKKLPNGWEWHQLTEVAELATGHTPSRRHPEYWNGNIPWIGIKDARAHHGSEINSTLQTTNQLGLDNSAAVLLPASTVCLSRTASVGYVTVMGQAMATSQDFVNWICSDAILPKFLMYLFIAEKQSLFRFGKGTTHTTIYFPEVKALHVGLPPVSEQRRIVAKIEELFSDLDAGVAALERAKANLKRYRAAVLKAAVEGRLTTEWRADHPDVEPASELLKRLLIERRNRWEQDQLAKYDAKGKKPPKGWKDKYKEPPPPDTKNLPELPPAWCWASVEQIITDSLNGFGKRSQKAGEPRIVLRLADIVGGEVSLASTREVNAKPEEIVKYALEPFDLLSIRVNGSPELVGRLILFNELAPEVLFCDHFIRIRTNNPALAKWLRIYGDSWPARKHVDQNKVSSAGQNTISQGTLGSLIVPLPPISEVEEICIKLEQINSIIEQNRLLADSNLKRTARLRQAILKRAFSGQLVPQDPGDEPAGELLQRLQAKAQAAHT